MLVPRTRCAPLPNQTPAFEDRIRYATRPRHDSRLAADKAQVHDAALLPSRENLGQPNPDKTQIKNIRVGEDVMPNEPDDGARRTVSRRHLFKQAAGAAAALSAATPALVTAQPVAAPTP